MNQLFVIQLMVSFIVGGVAIALLSFMAEKANKKVAGIILAFPTTVVLGFFFLGWTLSPQAVADVVPATLIPLGLSVLFTAVYSHIAEYSTKIIENKLWQIIITFVMSISVWFALAIPLAILKLNNLAVGVAGYVLLALAAHVLLQRSSYEPPVRLTYTLSQKVGRAIFVGSIIFLVVFLGKTVSPFFGGMFAMFPAAFSSLIMILHWYYGPKSLFPTMQKVAVGSIASFIYAIAAMLTFPPFGFIIGTFFAYGVSLIVALLIIKFQPKPREEVVSP